MDIALLMHLYSLCSLTRPVRSLGTVLPTSRILHNERLVHDNPLVELGVECTRATWQLQELALSMSTLNLFSRRLILNPRRKKYPQRSVSYKPLVELYLHWIYCPATTLR